MMDAYDKFNVFWLSAVLIGLGMLIYSSTVNRADCTQTALAQNYSADQIRKICR